MKIYYKTKLKKDSLTICPFKMIVPHYKDLDIIKYIHVGSWVCRECEFFIFWNKDYVDCKNPKIKLNILLDKYL